jgi:hypothetical protein
MTNVSEKLTPNETAYDNISYDKVLNGKSINDWVQQLHKHNCESNGWACYPLKKGAYGYDNLAHTVDKALNSRSANTTVVASHIHDAWSNTYKYWRDNNPHLTSKYNYRAPFKGLNDDRRNICANTHFTDLPQAEKDKDILFAKLLMKYI